MGSFDGSALDSGAQIAAFQFRNAFGSADVPQLVEVGRVSLTGEGVAFANLRLVSALRPVFLVLSNAAEAARSCAVIAYPSLVRGGRHHPEFLANSDRIADLECLFRYMVARAEEALRPRPEMRITIRLDGATGAEAIFSSDHAAWLALHSVKLAAQAAGDAFDAERLQATGVELADGPAAREIVLPADAIPTIAAVTGGAFAAGQDANGSCPGSFIVSDQATGLARWAVTLPSAPWLLDLQPQGVPSMIPVVRGLGRPAAPMCIQVTPTAVAERPVSQLMPLPPPALPLPARIGQSRSMQTLCVVDVEDVVQAERSLIALMAQDGADRLRFVLRLSSDRNSDLAAARTMLERVMPGRAQLADVVGSGALPVDWLLSLSEGCDSVFLTRDGIILHDTRTFGVLQRLLTITDTASSAPAILHENLQSKTTTLTHSESGYFPARVQLSGGPRLVLSAHAGALSALPVAVFPVLANTQSATLMSRAALAACGLTRLDPGAFGLATSARGLRHLCTTAVRATAIRRPQAREVMDPIGVHGVPLADWGRLLASVTIVEDLR
jgi:hypothetical protein